MSIASVSASASQGLAQQLQQKAQASVAALTTSVGQSGATQQAASTQQAFATQQTGQAHQHHSGDRGRHEPSTGATQLATGTAGGSTGINTVV
jgi:hypothetical protein